MLLQSVQIDYLVQICKSVVSTRKLSLLQPWSYPMLYKCVMLNLRYKFIYIYIYI